MATDLAVAKDKKTTLQDTYYKQRNVLSHKESLLDSAKLELEKVKNQINDFREQWQSVKNPKKTDKYPKVTITGKVPSQYEKIEDNDFSHNSRAKKNDDFDIVTEDTTYN